MVSYQELFEAKVSAASLLSPPSSLTRLPHSHDNDDAMTAAMMESDMRTIVASLLPDQLQHNSLRVAAGSDMTRNIAFALTSLQV